MTANRLQTIQSAAELLKRSTGDQCPGVLKLLPHLRDEDALTLARYGGLDIDRLAALSTASSLRENEIDDLLRRVLRFDLAHYISYYQAAERACITSKLSEQAVLALLPEFGSEREINFVLHDVLKLWDVEQQLLGDLDIEDAFDEDMIFDALPLVGFLMNRQLVFSTSIELLDASKRRNWPHWQVLWQYF